MNTQAASCHTQNQCVPSQPAINIVEDFKHLFLHLDKTNPQDELIMKLYRSDVVFEDSFHYVNGRDAFARYCNSLYENLEQSQFVFHDEWINVDKAALSWTLRFQHPRLNQGQEIHVQGMTQLLFDEQIYFHRDYFDGGNMLYENIPLLGAVVRKIKNRMVQ